jgi:hypothetical protein
MIRNSRSFLFLSVMMYRSCVHIIKLPNQLSNMATLKVVILSTSETVSGFPTVEEAVFQQSANTARLLSLNGHNHSVVTEIVCLSRR